MMPGAPDIPYRKKTKDVITDEEIEAVAQSAYFIFEVDLHDNSEAYIVSGDGTDDLDQVLAILARSPLVVANLDVGITGPSYKEADAADVLRLRAAFLSYYTGVSTGDLAKPDEYEVPVGTAMPL